MPHWEYATDYKEHFGPTILRFDRDPGPAFLGALKVEYGEAIASDSTPTRIHYISGKMVGRRPFRDFLSDWGWEMMAPERTRSDGDRETEYRRDRQTVAAPTPTPQDFFSPARDRYEEGNDPLRKGCMVVSLLGLAVVVGLVIRAMN